VSCPSCQWRYYVGAELLRAHKVVALCPKCRTEFDPRPYLEPARQVRAAAAEAPNRVRGDWVYYGRRST
jgi:predicted Zn finger-like uncharacterized protein